MIAIADSGSSKTDWRIISADGQITQATCAGINPYQHDVESILAALGSVAWQIDEGVGVKEVYFYGAGCSTAGNISKVKEALTATFPGARIEVNHDMLAAARALCGEEQGIACIIGTGMNTCLFDGHDILDQVNSLGYILADEGSGAYLGKRLMADYFRRNMPDQIAHKIEKRFGLTKELVLEQVYHESVGSKYLANFSKFIFQNIKEPYMYRLVYEAFGEFFERNILKYENYQHYKTHFTGAVAFYYSDILRQVANDKGVVVRNIIESPIAGLTLFHQKQLQA
jgi:N-acetylglucosamine kinase-like BadF-type ATPase